MDVTRTLNFSVNRTLHFLGHIDYSFLQFLGHIDIASFISHVILCFLDLNGKQNRD